MPISRALKCIFVHIPRTGGTSIEVALDLFGDWRLENRQSMFGLISSPELIGQIKSSPFLQHLGVKELRALRPGEFASFFRFAFVRNPWDRLVSVYSRMDTHMEMSARKAGIDLHKASFDEFVEWTEHFVHVHLLPQCSFVFDEQGDCGVHFIGRYERLGADFGIICERLGIHSELPHRNASKRGAYRQYYSDLTRSIVERRYSQDIERFGYRF
jgi:hypothetical protein